MALVTADDWLTAYGESHQNATNKAIHFICVPLIVFSLMGMLWAIPMPSFISQNVPYLNVATVFAAFCLVFYTRISIALALGMVLVVGAMVAGVFVLQTALGLSNGTLALVMLGIFGVSWVFQFIGHNIEGKKPSFLDDLKFLLVGPMWILGFVYRKVGIKY